MKISYRRVWAIILRHLYNFRHNLDRLTDAFYWPALDVIIWGLTFSAFEKQGGVEISQVAMVIFAGILWYVLWRGQGEITIGILEEFWSENFVNLFATPLTQIEWMLATCILGFIKLVMTVTFTAVIAWLLYSANILSLGLSVVPFIASLLITGWAFGFFMAGLFLRAGTNIQTLAWAGGFLLMPFSAVYYSFDTLPAWVQFIGRILPTSYIFEAMREVLFTGEIPLDMIIKSFGLNIIYLTIAILFFYKSFAKARENGLAQLH